MVAGQSGKLKVGAIIQARMKSVRLPDKILMPLPYPTGKPLLWWIFQGALKSKMIHEVVLASSNNKENDLLGPFCAANSVMFFRGSETDVLSRFTQVIRQNGFDVVVRLTGDNPIVDSTWLDNAIAHHIQNQNDYTHTSGLPLGMNFEVISAKALMSLEERSLTDVDREHVTHYIRNHADFKKEEIRLLPDENLEGVRLTIDYPSDFATLSLIFSLLNEGELPDLNLINKIKSEKKWIFSVNAGNRQKKQFASTSEEVEAALKLLEQNDLCKAAKILATQVS